MPIILDRPAYVYSDTAIQQSEGGEASLGRGLQGRGEEAIGVPMPRDGSSSAWVICFYI